MNTPQRSLNVDWSPERQRSSPARVGQLCVTGAWWKEAVDRYDCLRVAGMLAQPLAEVSRFAGRRLPCKESSNGVPLIWGGRNGGV